MASYLNILIQAAEPANYKLNYDEHYLLSVPLATTTTPGIASFDSDYFSVANGEVTLSDEYAGNLNNILEDIGDLQEGKVDKITPGDYGTFAYIVRKDIIDGIVNFLIQVSNSASPNTLVIRNANGRIKIANGVNSDEAVTLNQLTAATTNIQETALSVAVRTKLNKAISRVNITSADWEVLPVADRDINTMYFVGPYGESPNQYFVEWMYFVDTNNQGHWEALGSTLAVDLSDYFTKSEINALLAGKANIDGVYSGMSVGHADIADQINTDREIEDADTACPPVVFGTVGGNAEVQSGLMKFPELRGHTIKWNQLADCSDATFSTPGNAISSKLFIYRPSHKYIAVFDYEIESSIGDIYFLFGVWNNGLTSYRRHRIYPTSLKGRSAVIFTYDSHSETDLADGDEVKVLVQALGDSISASNKVSVSNIQFFDLTYDYGAGKEPATVSEFFASFPLPYYAYNAGTLLSSKSSSVDIVKRNQWDEEWENGIIESPGIITTGTRVLSKNPIRVVPGKTYYCRVGESGKIGRYILYDANMNVVSYSTTSTNTVDVPANACYFKFCTNADYGSTYNNDICIYIEWDTPGLPYVAYSKQHITLPNKELRSAGSVYDVLYQTGGGKRRIGMVDLGTLDWNYQGNGIFNSVQTIPAVGVTGQNKSNSECSSYSNEDAISVVNGSVNKSFTVYNNQNVYVCDTAYTDATTFKAAMDGVMLYYELATETDITTTENPGWTEYAEIDNFGTVKFNQDPAQTIPVPQAYFVRYTVNLVEFLDSLYVHCGGDVSKIALVSP